MKTENKTCEMFALMQDDKLIMIVAKEPNRPIVTDITDQLAMMFYKSVSIQLRKSE